MDHLHHRQPCPAWRSVLTGNVVWLCVVGCSLSGNGFKASDFTRDDPAAGPAPATSPASVASPPPAPSVSPPNVGVVPPAAAAPGVNDTPPIAEAPPNPSDVPVQPPVGGTAGELPSEPGEPGEPGEPAGPDRSLCSLSGSEVGIIGDSYVDLTTFTQHLQDLAREAGALGASETYVDHALLGASMNGVPNIPAQWPEALADSRSRGADGIRLVIMTGGGNDILVNNRQCLDFPTVADISDACKAVVDQALDAALELFEQFASDGVGAVVYFFYPHLPRFSLFGGSRPNTMLDYSLPLIREQCESFEEIPCYLVDLGPSFDDGSGFARPELISIDGIHPTDAGAVLMANDVWATMNEHCLAVE